MKSMKLIDPSDKDEAKEIFDYIDIDGSNAISYEELDNIIRST
jgi:Ca2+-binding EF-hand superfamily protein